MTALKFLVAGMSLLEIQACHAGFRPAPPGDLKAFTSAYFRIVLQWDVSADNEGLYRIERREGRSGPWWEIARIDANAGRYLDQGPPLTAETEYCYRVVAINATGKSDPSEVVCETTMPVPVISCSMDPGEVQRSTLSEVLSDDDVAHWREMVGLSSADPDRLQLITDDSLCQEIWDGIGLGDDAPLAAFFQLGSRYIVADLEGDRIIVADEQWNLVNPILVHF